MSFIVTQPPAGQPQSPRSVNVPFLQQPLPLGDAIARVTNRLHIPQCGGCKQRQDALNQRFVLQPGARQR